MKQTEVKKKTPSKFGAVLRRIFVHNLPYKLLAALAAFIIWFLMSF